MKNHEKKKILNEIFAPKPEEKILFLLNKKTDSYPESREIALNWFNIFQQMGESTGFSVKKIELDLVNQNNAPLTEEIVDEIKKVNIVIALTEYSITSSIATVCFEKNSITRGASIIGMNKKMEDIIFNTNYKEIKDLSIKIENILNRAVGASIKFSSGDNIYIDLRNRKAGSDRGECVCIGQFINLPSGEGFKSPYEGVKEEKSNFGESKTEGVLPLKMKNELIKINVKNNKIIDVIGKTEEAEKLKLFFDENESRRNIAELGIGCNKNAKIIGKTIVDEKVGLHIAYGMSSHIGGKIYSDIHQDIVYSKGCDIEAENLILINDDKTKTELIKNSILNYDLIEKI